jgi:cadmium resistance protein CadD (predicted permease)
VSDVGDLALVRTIRSTSEDEAGESALNPGGILGVASNTCASGGDDTAICTPVFRSLRTSQAAKPIMVFLISACALRHVVG